MEDKACSSNFTNVQSLVFLLDTTHQNMCLTYNRAMNYRYDCSLTTASAYDDNGIFPACAGQFARATKSNITKGLSWQLRIMKPKQLLILSVLGELTNDIVQVLLKSLQSKKKINVVLVSTTNVFSGFTQNLTNPVIWIKGDPEVLLPNFDGRCIKGEELARVPGITVESNEKGKMLLGSVILSPIPEPWVY